MIDDPKFMDYMEKVFKKIFFVPQIITNEVFNQFLGAMSIDTLYDHWLKYKKTTKKRRKK
jgi:hypothetical protein